MATIDFRLQLAPAELAEAAEDVERLLDGNPALDLCPACRHVLEALDDAITDAVVDGGSTSVRH